MANSIYDPNYVRQQLEQAGIIKKGKNLPTYLVGGNYVVPKNMTYDEGTQRNLVDTKSGRKAFYSEKSKNFCYTDDKKGVKKDDIEFKYVLPANGFNLGIQSILRGDSLNKVTKDKIKDYISKNCKGVFANSDEFKTPVATKNTNNSLFLWNGIETDEKSFPAPYADYDAYMASTTEKSEETTEKSEEKTEKSEVTPKKTTQDIVSTSNPDVEQFQTEFNNSYRGDGNGIKVDGILGNETKKALRDAGYANIAAWKQEMASIKNANQVIQNAENAISGAANAVASIQAYMASQTPVGTGDTSEKKESYIRKGGLLAEGKALGPIIQTLYATLVKAQDITKKMGDALGENATDFFKKFNADYASNKKAYDVYAQNKKNAEDLQNLQQQNHTAKIANDNAYNSSDNLMNAIINDPKAKRILLKRIRGKGRPSKTEFADIANAIARANSAFDQISVSQVQAAYNKLMADAEHGPEFDLNENIKSIVSLMERMSSEHLGLIREADGYNANDINALPETTSIDKIAAAVNLDAGAGDAKIFNELVNQVQQITAAINTGVQNFVAAKAKNDELGNFDQNWRNAEDYKTEFDNDGSKINKELASVNKEKETLAANSQNIAQRNLAITNFNKLWNACVYSKNRNRAMKAIEAIKNNPNNAEVWRNCVQILDNETNWSPEQIETTINNYWKYADYDPNAAAGKIDNSAAKNPQGGANMAVDSQQGGTVANNAKTGHSEEEPVISNPGTSITKLPKTGSGTPATSRITNPFRQFNKNDLNIVDAYNKKNLDAVNNAKSGLHMEESVQKDILGIQSLMERVNNPEHRGMLF